MTKATWESICTLVLGSADSVPEVKYDEELPAALVSTTKFQLIVNFKTAKAFGLTIPHSLQLRADEVIQ